MKIFFWFRLLLAVASCALVGPFSVPEYADTEVATNVPFAVIEGSKPGFVLEVQ